MKPEIKKAGPKVLFWDIEATNLNANFGYILCIGYKWLGEKKTHIISIRDFKDAFKNNCTNDKEVVKAFGEVYGRADMGVTWYGLRFDEPFVQTRRLLHKLAPMVDRPHFDGWRVAKYRLKFTSNRLDTVSRSLPFDEAENRKLKTPLESQHWVRGAAGHVPSIKYIEDHCIADVDVLEEVYLKLRPFSKTMPNISLMMGHSGCPSCGSLNTVKEGLSATAAMIKQQHSCKVCGHWFLSPYPKSLWMKNQEIKA